MQADIERSYVRAGSDSIPSTDLQHAILATEKQSASFLLHGRGEYAIYLLLPAPINLQHEYPWPTRLLECRDHLDSDRGHI